MKFSVVMLAAQLGFDVRSGHPTAAPPRPPATEPVAPRFPGRRGRTKVAIGETDFRARGPILCRRYRPFPRPEPARSQIARTDSRRRREHWPRERPRVDSKGRLIATRLDIRGAASAGRKGCAPICRRCRTTFHRQERRLISSRCRAISLRLCLHSGGGQRPIGRGSVPHASSSPLRKTLYSPDSGGDISSLRRAPESKLTTRRNFGKYPVSSRRSHATESPSTLRLVYWVSAGGAGVGSKGGRSE